MLDEIVDARRRQRRRRVLPARHARLPDRPHARDRGRARPRRRPRRLRAAHARAARRAPAPRPTKPARPRGDSSAIWRELLDEHGPTEFTGRQEYVIEGERSSRSSSTASASTEADEGATVEVVLDRTPFYAESGGQVGDTGTITTAAAARSLDVRDTHYGIARLGHRARVRACAAARSREGDEVEAAIDGVRRDRIRRNHTATHILHWALREVLGSHVQQAGSIVAPDRLRFDFTHHEPVTAEQLAQVERLANAQVISDAPVRHYETTKAEAERIGAIAFFGEKYGDIVRVLEAGPVDRAVRRHARARARLHRPDQDRERELDRLEPAPDRGGDRRRRVRVHRVRGSSCCAAPATLLRAAPKEVPDKIERLSEQVRALQDELQRLQGEGGGRPRRPSSRRRPSDGAVDRAPRRPRATTSCSSSRRRRCARSARGVVALAGTGPTAQGRRSRSR